ncbi:MAG TPA: prolipoprotein diacylglyceryl transferase family protein, partial [Candidatus Limnocylindria bacterium]|nr:prolipoprotein diacylglyceryl transferase family protein [Candidatus Limnocylindria bacterium]
LYLLWRSEWLRMRLGMLSGAFLCGYGMFRIIAEVFREPDVHIGFLAFGTTMGQWLSLPMVVLGAFFIFRAKQRG